MYIGGFRRKLAPVVSVCCVVVRALCPVVVVAGQVGGHPPQRGAVGAWINVVRNTSTEALETLRDLTQEGVRLEKNDFKRISKSWLSDKQVQALKSKPEQQALVLELYAR